MGNYGGGATPLGLPRMPQGNNAVRESIPVAKVSDLLLHPGEPYDFNGEHRIYPDIRLVYWAGGNPFHHHQDLSRLTRAFGRPDTVVVHETHWTATARHADIVIPATTVLERDDFAASHGDLALRAMPRVLTPHGQARDEYDTYTDLAERLGVREEFTEGRTSREWMRVAYERWRALLARRDLEVPGFDEFWARGRLDMPARVEDETHLGEFREDPEANALRTPSGRIELYSETVASFGYEDCPGHPVWLPGPAVTGLGPGSGRHRTAGEGDAWPLVLVANQPNTRLHSQQDMGGYSVSRKIHGRDPLRMHPRDAESAGVREGDVVRVSSPRGSCLAGLVLSDALRPGVVQLSTGAWYDPSSADVTCVHGNPNALTEDAGTSSLSQGCTGQLVRVRVEPYGGALPPVRAFDPPAGVEPVEA
jgi:biotin/methionine sulfoxide reductase